jgi:hypothetical protein
MDFAPDMEVVAGIAALFLGVAIGQVIGSALLSKFAPVTP